MTSRIHELNITNQFGGVNRLEQISMVYNRRMMKNKIDQLITELGVSAYKFAQDTGITKNTVYLLKNNPLQFPTGEVLDRIINTYGVGLESIIEHVPDSKENQGDGE